ncbi:MAG: ferritin [Bacteroides sp. SM1_62]|nr:MAG: ferritin [Bacteroides sp. SM23_62]KPL26643.1 MAG: ferritin [Bacteroides sp. SM1_62]
MLSKKVEDILNVQVDKEGYSSHLYLSMAVWAETEGLGGIADWLYAQAEEERIHMLKLVRYINERDGKAKIIAVKEPPAEFGSVREMFDKVMEHEQFITGSINEIVQVCIDENDHTTHNWIQWFVTEQIEEEASVKALIDKLKLVGDHHMYMFDRDIMGMRGGEGEAAAE